jgi:hypothetical protein
LPPIVVSERPGVLLGLVASICRLADMEMEASCESVNGSFRTIL